MVRIRPLWQGMRQSDFPDHLNAMGSWSVILELRRVIIDVQGVSCDVLLDEIPNQVYMVPNFAFSDIEYDLSINPLTLRQQGIHDTRNRAKIDLPSRGLSGEGKGELHESKNKIKLRCVQAQATTTFEGHGKDSLSPEIGWPETILQVPHNCCLWDTWIQYIASCARRRISSNYDVSVKKSTEFDLTYVQICCHTCRLSRIAARLEIRDFQGLAEFWRRHSMGHL